MLDIAKQTQRKQKAMLDVVKAVSLENDSFEDILVDVVHLSNLVVSCERLTLWIVDEIHQELWCK